MKAENEDQKAHSGIGMTNDIFSGFTKGIEYPTYQKTSMPVKSEQQKSESDQQITEQK